MPVTNYYTVNGEVSSEVTNGVRTDYMTDALGSVTGTLDQSGNVLNTYRYKPFGGLLAKTGVAVDPKFLWNGGSGYRSMKTVHADEYVRARTLGTAEGAWTSTDGLWPREPKFVYATNSPASLTDPAGTQVTSIRCPPQLPTWAGAGRPSYPPNVPGLPVACLSCKCYNQALYDLCTTCYATDPLGQTKCHDECSAAANWYYQACKGDRHPLPVEVWSPSHHWGPIIPPGRPSPPVEWPWTDPLYVDCMANATTQDARNGCWFHAWLRHGIDSWIGG